MPVSESRFRSPTCIDSVSATLFRWGATALSARPRRATGAAEGNGDELKLMEAKLKLMTAEAKTSGDASTR